MLNCEDKIFPIAATLCLTNLRLRCARPCMRCVIMRFALWRGERMDAGWLSCVSHKSEFVVDGLLPWKLAKSYNG